MSDSKNWNELTIKEKLELTKTTLKIDTYDELSNVLQVNRRTIFNWLKGQSKPSRKIIEKLYRLCHMYTWGSDLYGKDAFIAQYTIAYDAVRHVYRDIIDTGDSLSMSNAIHSVSTKIAELLTKKNETSDYQLLIHIHSIYGSPDYGEILNITALNKEGDYLNKSVDVCVKIGEVKGVTEIAYISEFVNSKGVVEIRRGGLINDFAITRLTTTIITFFNKK